MSLKDLKLKGMYDSDTDDLVEDFYIPVLSEATSYCRIAGYFSSTALTIAAEGIANLVQNKGKMKLVMNVIMNIQDGTSYPKLHNKLPKEKTGVVILK